MATPDVVAALQSLHAAIAGVATAPIAMPASLNTADLPCVLVWPGTATWRQQAVGLRRLEREYIVRCYVAPVAQGKGVDEGWQAALALLDAFGQAYENDIALGGMVDQIASVVDMGLGVHVFAGIAYHGFEYRLKIVQKE